jgi:threonylcarbamoyladenosine tRNA methylthiotransferase MtaB
MTGRGFHTITLGCKLNQFDTAALEGELELRGFRPEPDPSLAAVVIVNTCTVTAKADAEARRSIRAIRRRNLACRLLVTGCYAERDAEGLRRLAGVDRVFGNADKARLAHVLDEMGLAAPTADLPRREREGEAGAVPAGGDRGCDAALDLPRALHFGERSRAFLKVQEGCRLACSYCIIPRVRGASRSVGPAAVEAAARTLFQAGYREIVLTGVNVGDWGRDLVPRSDLAALLRRLLEVAGANRIRLNSLEPLTVTDEVVELMAGDARLAPHLQVPLQSGSPEILRRMRRNYGTEAYLERLSRLRDRVPHVGLGADVIVGFPGETEAHFEQTYGLIAASPLNYLHVFAWSPRPGTPAAALPERVHGTEVRDRSARLRELAARLGHRFRSSFEGRELDAVVLGAPRSDGRVRALTGNFIEVSLPPGSAADRDLVRVRVEHADRELTSAVVIGTPAWAATAAVRATA